MALCSGSNGCSCAITSTTLAVSGSGTAANPWTIDQIGPPPEGGDWPDGYTTYDARYVMLGGDTMTGDLTLPGDPDAPLEAATKQYVDSLVAVAGAGIPTGGTTGEVLAKDSATDYDVSWADVAAAPIRYTINAQTGTTYTIALTDENKLVTLNNAGAITLTYPTNATVAMPVGSRVDVAQIGAGQVTVAGAGVTFIASPTLKFRAQGSAVSLIKTATDTVVVTGDLSS